MDIGTVDTLDEESEAKPGSLNNKRTFGTGRPTGGGGGNDGGGGDNDGKLPPKQPETDAPKPEIAKVFMWFLLLVVLMTFGGLIAAYVVIATNKPLEWNPFALPKQVWVSTALIILSGLTYHLGLKNLISDKFIRARNFFVATAVLGCAFISSQIMVWVILVNEGINMRGNPYAGLFYIMTAVHAAHVLGGVIALGYVLIKTWDVNIKRISLPKLKNEARAIGWYWHTMDLLWLFLVYLLGFWR